MLTANPPAESDDPRYAYMKTIIAAHKYLDDGGEAGLTKLKEMYPDFTIAPTSILDDESMAAFQLAIFKTLGIIRVYTKKVGHDPEFKDPIILPIGGTVDPA